MHTAARLVVVLVGCYLLALGLVAWMAPARAERFLGGFAGSARAHYLELSLRLVAGWAVLASAPHMLFPGFFTLFGWVLLLTTAGLFAIPWRLHRRFAEWGVPRAMRHLKLVAVASFALGGLIIACLVAGRG